MNWLDPILFLAGAALICAAIRWWRPAVTGRAIALSVLLVFTFFEVPLVTDLVQVPTDIAYQWQPWKGTASHPPPQNPLVSEVALQILPFRHLSRQRSLRLEAPLWASELGSGQPLLGNAQSAPFAPLHLLAIAVPAIRGLTLAAAWQTLVALLLAYALSLRLGATEAGAALCGVAFAFSAWSIAWLYHPLSMVAAWIPGVLLGIVLVARGESRGSAGLIVCATAAALSGHPETLLHTALAATVVAAMALATTAAGRRISALGRISAAVAHVACFSAPALLPVVEALPESVRFARVSDNAEAVAPPPFQASALRPLVDPLAFGSPRTGDYHGLFNFNDYCTHYAGALTLALAFAGAIALRGPPLTILLLAVGALLVALRVEPLYSAVSSLPGLDLVPHDRLRLFWNLGLALAAGLSLDRLLATPRGRRVTAFCLFGVGTATFLWSPGSRALGAQVWWWTTILGLVALLMAILVGKPHRGIAWLAVVLVVADLFALGLRFHPLVPPGRQLEPGELIQRLKQLQRATPGNYRVVGEGFHLMPNLAAYHGIWDPRHNDPMAPRRPYRLAARRMGRIRSWTIQSPDHYDAAYHRRLGIRWVLTDQDRTLPEPWELLDELDGGRIWENQEALPLFFVPTRVRSSPEEALARDFALRNHQLGELAVVREAEGSGRLWKRQHGQVQVTSIEANGFGLEAQMAEAGLVASSVTFASGWRVEVDGARQPALLVDSAFLGFRVAAGSHRIRLVFEPRTWRWSLVAAGVGILSLLWMGLVSTWRR